MYQFIIDYYSKSFSSAFARQLSIVTFLVIAFAVSLLVRSVIKYIIVKFATKMSVITRRNWDDILLKRKFFHNLSNLSVPIVLRYISEDFWQQSSLWQNFINILSTIIFIFLINSLINAFEEIYSQFEISKIRPIRGLLQITKGILIGIGAIVSIAMLLGERPLVLLSGVGAMTAVTSLIFKDSILGFVAGIQLTSNDMVRIGDWIEVPKHSADGSVIEISLTTVKVRNFDNTITTIPAYSLVSDSFINWRGMRSSGGRRIKRAIYIDATYVKLCDENMLEKYERIYLLKDYIQRKKEEIEEYNSQHKFDISVPVNGRRLTNLGTFRAYVYEYIKQHHKIRKDMTIMVRQLATENNGIPLEIYAFTNTVEWVEYEAIQSDIFDHLYSIVTEFDLAVFQNISGNDLRNTLNKS